MKDFQTSLLREKFVIREIGNDMTDDEPVVALSNRMDMQLINSQTGETDHFVLRTQNMHSCVRLGAAIAREFYERGSIRQRVQQLRWDFIWRDVIKGYEKDWNDKIWGVIYQNGRPVFAEGNHHPFLDIIEQCAVHAKSEYKNCLPFAEQAFQQAGKIVKIDYDANVALVLSCSEEKAKVGIMLRGASKKTTFNFTATPSIYAMKPVKLPTLLSVCAAYLEGIQLAFQVGLMNRKYELGLIEKYSDEYRKNERSTERLTNLARAAVVFREDYDVKYRPDAPDFQAHVADAENYAIKILKPLIDEKIAKGEIDPGQWVE